MNKRLKAASLLVLLLGLYGCASGPTDPRIKPDYGRFEPRAIAEPYPMIEDKALYSLYKRVRGFASASWEYREAELFKMINNQLSQETVNYYNHLLDIDQKQAISKFLGPVSSQVATHCNWYKPVELEISYVQGGRCINGQLNGIAQFTETGKYRDYTWWVQLKDGIATKGVFGQSRQQRAIPDNKISDNPFHNWSGQYRFDQVEALGVGSLDKDFQWRGYAARQGDGRSYRHIGEFQNNELNGWGIWIKKEFTNTEDDIPEVQGVGVRYLGQFKNDDWDGAGVYVSKTLFYITRQGHWPPKNIEFSLGWKSSENYKSNGPTVKYVSGAKEMGRYLQPSMYYGYHKDDKRQGVGGFETLHASGSNTFIGSYKDSKKVGRHQYYTHGKRQEDWCYTSDAYGPCSAVNGGDGFGKMLAIVGGMALAGSANMSGAQRAEFMTNYTADVLTDSGGTNMQNWGSEQVQQMQSSQGSGGQAGKGNAQAAMKEANYTFTCPDTQKQHSLSVPYFTSGCLTAAKNFAKVNGCNMVNEMSSASQQCSSACGNPQCLEQPSGGVTGSGDADQDFLNSMGQ